MGLKGIAQKLFQLYILSWFLVLVFGSHLAILTPISVLRDHSGRITLAIEDLKSVSQP